MGTHSKVEELLVGRKIHVASSPEFVREGSAVRDFFSPDRIVIGTRTTAIAKRLERIFDGIKSTILVTDPESAETIKNASNSFLAMKLSFINAIAIICELYGADILDVSRGIGLDSRIGSNFLQAGPGWGGSCLPKDANSLAFTANARGYSFSMLQEAIAINEHMQTHIVKKTEEFVGGNLRGSKVAVWGLTFKANTDDLRDSPAIRIVSQLLREGASIACFDPMVRTIQKSINGASIHDSIEESVENSDLILVLTEWSKFREIDPEFIGQGMAKRNVFDCRNLLDRKKWEKAGFRFKALGRA
jgi:UDPglucose 6-dehydrogenase